MNIFVEGKNKYKISENKNFILKQPDPTDIFIKMSYIPIILKQNPILFEKYLTESKIFRDEDAIIKSKTGKQIYIKYTTTSDFFTKGVKNDCLHLSERLSLLNPHYNSNVSIFRVKSDKTQRKFGVNPKQNKDIAEQTNKNYLHENPKYYLQINPKIGEAYAMVPLLESTTKKSCPYHVASVIFQDGETNITLEADAGKITQKPIFDMYSTTKPQFTFYANHWKTYTPLEEILYRKDIKLPVGLHLFKEENKKPKPEKSIQEEKPLRRSSRLNKNGGNKYTRKIKN